MKNYNLILQWYYEEVDYIDIMIYNLRLKRKILSWRIRQYEFKKKHNLFSNK